MLGGAPPGRSFSGSFTGAFAGLPIIENFDGTLPASPVGGVPVSLPRSLAGAFFPAVTLAGAFARMRGAFVGAPVGALTARIFPAATGAFIGSLPPAGGALVGIFAPAFGSFFASLGGGADMLQDERYFNQNLAVNLQQTQREFSLFSFSFFCFV